MDACPECPGRVYRYKDGNWTEWICWRCGHYRADTPAFQMQPDLFRNVVRQNGEFFMKKYAKSRWLVSHS
ncbi:MAG: hypothetical protein ACREAO_07770 [Nitrososphaera sp.]|jgi:hypothetical protein